MWKHAVKRGLAVILTAGMSLGMLGGNKTSAAQFLTAGGTEEKIREERVFVNKKEAAPVQKRIMKGDWDRNGTLDLTDVRNILRAALNLVIPDGWQMYVSSDNGDIQLMDAQTALKRALDLQKQSYIEVLDSQDIETIYEEVLERDWSMTLYHTTQLCQDKAEAQEFLDLYPAGYEGLKQAVAGIREEQLEGKKILIYARLVQTDSEEQAGIEHIYKKEFEDEKEYTIEFEDSSEVVGKSNYLYVSVMLLPEEFGESEYYETGFVNNHQDVKADISACYVKMPPSETGTALPSYAVITSAKEAQNFINEMKAAYKGSEAQSGEPWSELQNMLDAEDSYYKQYTRIVYKGSVPFLGGVNKLNWTVSGDALEVNFDSIIWQMGVTDTDSDIDSDKQYVAYYYVLDLKKDLTANRRIVFSASEQTKDVSLTGEQTHFVLEPDGDYYYDFWFGIGNEEQRTDVLNKLAAKFDKTNQQSYHELEETLKTADLGLYDVMVTFGLNQTWEFDENDETEKVLVSVRDHGVEFDYSRDGMTFEPGKQIVSVLYLPKGSLEPHLSICKNKVPGYDEEYITQRLMTITKIEKENKKIFLHDNNSWWEKENVIHVSDQTKITCNEKVYGIENLHEGDIVKVDFVDWVNGNSVIVLQGNSYIELIYSKETGEAYKGLTAQQLQDKFPHNAYWNHPVSEDHDEESYEDTGRCNNPDGYTWKPCKLGEYGCNSFAGTELCYGFAAKLAYDVYGSTYYEWPEQENSIKNAKPGDVIYYYGNGATADFGHRAMIIDINGTKLQLAECNWSAHDIISWGRWTDATKFKTYTLFSAPFELPGGGEGVLD